MQRPDEQHRLWQLAQAYHSEALAGPNEQYHVFLRDAVIPPQGGRSALELGCGKGLWTGVLSARYDRLDVVDGSPELLESAIQRCCPHAKVNAHAALAEEFLFTCGHTWQHIFMTFLLEHLEDPVAVLQRVHSCMEPEGMLFLAVPNANSVHRVLAVRAGLIPATDTLSDNDLLVGHRRVYSRNLLREHLQRSDFQIIEEKAIGLKPLNLKQLEKLPAAVVSALCSSGDLVPENAAYLVAVAKSSKCRSANKRASIMQSPDQEGS